MKIRLLMGMVLSMLVMSSQAMAFSFSQFYGEQMSKHAARTTALLADIEAGDSEEIPADMLYSYYTEAGWMIYNGLLVYSNEYNSLPDDLSSLATSGYVEFWPVDPVTGESMAVSEISNPQPGSFVLQKAPSSHYSLVGSMESYQLVPLSFELSVIGHDGNSQLSYRPMDENSWGQVPANAVFQVGCFSELAETTLAKLIEFVNNSEGGVTSE